MKTRISCSVFLALSLFVVASGCRKKTPELPPPPPPPKPVVVETAPPPPRPAVDSFTAEPATIQRGQSATLRWTVRNAAEMAIEPGIGAVTASGNRQVFPSSSTTYTLRAKGPGGTATATARVNVTEPPPPPPPPKPAARRTAGERLASEAQDVFFEYDKYDIREDARAVLTRNADALKSIFQEFPSFVVTLEGHCDERGSAEYNIGLGDRRSTSAKDFLTQLGVPADKLRTVSYGKERPQCTESDESCWQRNRRVHFAPGQ